MLKANFLAERGYQACFFDNRGVGRSGIFFTSEMAKDALDLLEHLGWTSNTHIVGISMGGMISLELSLIAPPGMIGSLVLTSTHAGRTLVPLAGLIALGRSMLCISIASRARCNTELLYPTAWLDSAAPEKTGYKTNRERTFVGMLETARAAPEPTIIGIMGQSSAVIRHYVSAKRLREIRDKGFPILVVTGTIDLLVRPSNSYYLAKELEARVEVFRGSGHVVPVEQEERYNKLLLEFIESAGDNAT
ncbi:alpha/beta-hydrolase [Basidiobolus meristosporus CBS 931.73]|uniref:Alpha/beta-hydrolase n=1 Tax=Basidiobolus meristosporus CBS 931.73 TaxID=1314790 RepID=A0A1Y1YDJ6_9FUNG|nr:alpha/beta-hydrolase [Basidiobolus meristosporus CBS 931.73]|eukprot:ORX96090.1 alpha/beta-hydrolase [Basidiobolus meristosporus CBS 931.73]